MDNSPHFCQTDILKQTGGWDDLFCQGSYRQPLGIHPKYRLSLIKSSTIALSNLWTVFLKLKQRPRLLRQDDTCADLVQSHCCLVLGIDRLQHHFRGSWPHQQGSEAHPHVCEFNLIQDAQKWQRGKSCTCSPVWELGSWLVSFAFFFLFILFYSHLPTLHTWLMLNTARPLGNVTFIF